MILGLFRREPRRAQIESLYDKVVAAARDEHLYAALGVPDTVEGRFEAVALHLVLVLRRLRALPAPAGDVAQDLVDHFFRQMDAAMRESGVGDMGVPKRMKKLAAAFYSRAQAYDRGLDARNAAMLAQDFAHQRIVPDGGDPGLARYAIALDERLTGLSFADLLTPGSRLPADAPEAARP